MIELGLTTWTKHPQFATNGKTPTLMDYAGNLPTVEIDTPFYGIPTEATVAKWVAQVPEGFTFVVKANQVMTGHDRGKEPVNDAERAVAFRQFKAAFKAMKSQHHLRTVLFQFPPFFERNVTNFQYLRDIRTWMPQWPITIEFRNPSWYDQNTLDDVAAYLQSLQMTLATVDEPHNLNDGVPLLPIVTNQELAFFRFHGRNEDGWFNQGSDWRGKRTLYRYSDEELTEMANVVKRVSEQAKQTTVIFNNNSGGDAADNALKFQQLLGLNWSQLGPKQMDLF